MQRIDAPVRATDETNGSGTNAAVVSMFMRFVDQSAGASSSLYDTAVRRGVSKKGDRPVVEVTLMDRSALPRSTGVTRSKKYRTEASYMTDMTALADCVAHWAASVSSRDVS
jgi:hypothetical protein